MAPSKAPMIPNRIWAVNSAWNFANKVCEFFCIAGLINPLCDYLTARLLVNWNLIRALLFSGQITRSDDKWVFSGPS